MADKKTDNKDIESGWIRELAAILHETGLTEIEVEKGEVRLRVSRAAAQTLAAVAAPAVALAPAVAAPPVTQSKSAPSKHPGAVPSPMVGTAYLSPAPGAPPFVKKGDQVREGQTIMIIEAMKTMNAIAAPRAGVVADIFVTDAQPVEFGEALAIIE
jgi:acetyl-CoA carboxylase biotin carboxyl carrier protein